MMIIFPSYELVPGSGEGQTLLAKQRSAPTLICILKRLRSYYKAPVSPKILKQQCLHQKLKYSLQLRRKYLSPISKAQQLLVQHIFTVCQLWKHFREIWKDKGSCMQVTYKFYVVFQKVCEPICILVHIGTKPNL